MLLSRMFITDLDFSNPDPDPQHCTDKRALVFLSPKIFTKLKAHGNIIRDVYPVHIQDLRLRIPDSDFFPSRKPDPRDQKQWIPDPDPKH
jgi:hypothetical protein